MIKPYVCLSYLIFLRTTGTRWNLMCGRIILLLLLPQEKLISSLKLMKRTCIRRTINPVREFVNIFTEPEIPG